MGGRPDTQPCWQAGAANDDTTLWQRPEWRARSSDHSASNYTLERTGARRRSPRPLSVTVRRPMKMRLGIVLLAIITLGSDPSMANEGWTAQFDRVGPLRVGMSLDDLSRVLHQRFQVPDDPRERACVYVSATRPKGISLMIVDGRLARIDVTSRDIPTIEGARVGDLEERVKHLYGSRLNVTPHHYTAPDGHYLTIPSEGGRFGMRFETYQGRVSMFYIGKFPEIEFVEQCL